RGRGEDRSRRYQPCAPGALGCRGRRRETMDEPSAQPRDDPETRVVHEPERSRFQVTLGGGTAELRYQRLGKTLVLVHTGAPPELEGRGIGGALVRAAFDHVRGHGMVVVPLCPFVRAYLKRHPECLELVDPEYRRSRLA